MPMLRRQLEENLFASWMCPPSMFYLSLPALLADIRFFLNRICIPDWWSKQNKNSIEPLPIVNAISFGSFCHRCDPQ
jgi:hypothetical protein